MEIKLPSHVQNIISLLERGGFEAYAVGGCVRDSVLGRVPNDWDVTTSAKPHEVEKCLCGFKIIETGLKHGTVTAPTATGPVEITTYRIDGGYSDNRHPDSVRFTDDLKADLSRRDFTVNAMAYGASRGIVDYFGGMDDIRRGVIRCVGEPEKRFNEDGLRVLRALRFSSVLGFSVEGGTSLQINACRELLGGIAHERVRDEFTKLLCGKNVFDVLQDYREAIAVFIPEIRPCFGFAQNNPHHIYDVWGHILKAVQSIEPDPLLRAAMFFHDIGKPLCYTEDAGGTGHFYGHAQRSAETAQAVLKRLRYPRRFSEMVTELVGLHGITVSPDEKAVKRRLNKTGEKIFRLLLKVKEADTKAKSPVCFNQLGILEATEKTLDRVTGEKECFTQKDLAVDGFDLMAAGVQEGKEVGEALRGLLFAVIDGKCGNTREELLYYAKKHKMP